MDVGGGEMNFDLRGLSSRSGEGLRTVVLSADANIGAHNP